MDATGVQVVSGQASARLYTHYRAAVLKLHAVGEALPHAYAKPIAMGWPAGTLYEGVVL